MENQYKTFQDLLDFIRSGDLPFRKKRDMISALVRTAEMLACAPINVPVAPRELRPLLKKIRPAAHGISRKSLANIRSLLTYALAQAGQLDPPQRGLAKDHPAWGRLMRTIAEDKELRSGLAAFANWCASKGIAPQLVSDVAVQEFLAWLENRTLHRRPHELARRIPLLWHKARAHFDVWPEAELARLSFRPVSSRLSWTDLSDSFRRDAEAYVAKRKEPDIFDESHLVPRRPLADSTLRQHQEHIRLAASILVRDRKIPAAEITSLTQLIEPDAFKTVLRYYLGQRANGEPSSFATSMAQTLIQVAQYYVAASTERINQLKKLARKLPEPAFDLTPKNKLLIRQLEPNRTRAKLIFLPERLLNEVASDLKINRFRPVDAQCAIAIDILLAIPLRPQNLSTLNWRHHFQAVDNRLLLHIPAAETKSKKKDIVAEIPEDVARRINWYRNHVLPRQGGDRSGYLFVTQQGACKHQKTLAGQIIKVIDRHVGVHMTPHQFRHFAAVAYLEENPEDFETPRALLGHAFSKTTRIYAGSSTRRAGRVYGSFLVKARNDLRCQQPIRRKP